MSVLHLTRRAAVGGALAMPALRSRLNAQGLEKVTFTLSWLPEGFFAYVFAAHANGYWKQRGLDVAISRGNGSIPAAQAVVNGQYDFGISNASVVIQLATQKVALRSLALMDYDPAMGVAVRADSPIKSPRDLAGKTVAQTLASSDAAYFAPFCAANGVDLKGINLLNMDARVRNQALVEKQVDAITGFASSMLSTIKSGGTDIRLMLYSEFGIPMYGDIALLTQPPRADARPDLCQAMTDGMMEGVKFAVTQIDETLKLFLSEVAEAKLMRNGPEFVRLGMAVHRWNLLSSTDPKTQGLGWADPAKIAHLAETVLKYQAPAGTPMPDTAAIFSNRFAGRVRMSDAEWSATAAATEFVRSSLRA